MKSRLTTTQFLDALGLKYSEYNGAKTLLKFLKSKGVIKELDRVSYSGRGRRIIRYEMPTKIVIKIPSRKRIPEKIFAMAAARAERLGWCQSDLAREIGISPSAVSTRLMSMRMKGIKTPDISSRSGWIRSRT